MIENDKMAQMSTLSACTWCRCRQDDALISNPDLPSKSLDHRRENGERAAEGTSTEVFGGCGWEVAFQFRCSSLVVVVFNRTSKPYFLQN